MGKISPVSSKYIIHASIEIDGVVEKPDVIGAIFGQTEGLLGADLELRELQRSGRIGRIEVNVDTKIGKTQGSIIVPSSLDKAETSIVGAALEIIQRIGPCNAKIRVENIEDVRISKRKLVIERAKELLKQMNDSIMPDSQELADEVAHSVRMMEVQAYGKDRLPAGPAIDESDEVIVCEGRADVLNLLKHGIKNVIGMNGTSVPQTIVELAKRKTITAFVDGDRGGDLIIKELLSIADIDFVTKAPDGKEVEEITNKEIYKALRGRITAEQAKLDFSRDAEKPQQSQQHYQQSRPVQPPQQQQFQRPQAAPYAAPIQRPYQSAAPMANRFVRRPAGAIVSDEEKAKFKSMLEDLIGTRGAYILDEKLNILGKVPISEITATVKSLNSGIYAIVFDGAVEKPIAEVAEKANIRHIVAMENKLKPGETRLNVLTAKDL
jgi:DNA primase